MIHSYYSLTIIGFIILTGRQKTRGGLFRNRCNNTRPTAMNEKTGKYNPALGAKIYRCCCPPSITNAHNLTTVTTILLSSARFLATTIPSFHYYERRELLVDTAFGGVLHLNFLGLPPIMVEGALLPLTPKADFENMHSSQA